MRNLLDRLRKRTLPGKRLLLANPVSGSFHRFKELVYPETEFLAPLETEVYLTTGPGDATRRVRQALKQKEFSQILIAGGDGTVNEALNGYYQHGKILSKEIPLGILNTGSGNDFYRTLLAFSNDYETAIIENKYTLVDTGSVTMEPDGPTFYFLNIASIGLSGAVIASMNHSPLPKNRASYLYHSVKTLLGHRALRFTLEWKEESLERTVSGQFYNIFFCNGRSNGGGMQFAPEASPIDGLLDVCLMGGNRRTILLSAPKIYGGHIRDVRGTDLFQTTEIRITPESSLFLETDGELLPFDAHRYDSLVCRIHTRSLPLIL